MTSGARKKKVNKTDKIPKVGDWRRELLVVGIQNHEDYKEALNKGIKLLTEEEIDSLEGKYAKDGITWKELEQELVTLGIEMTKPTFRKHIQEKLLPEAEGYRSEDGKRVAVFPFNTISHINLNRYCLKFANLDFLENLTEALMKGPLVTYYEAAHICHTSETYDDLDFALLNEVFFDFESSATKAISTALKSKPKELRRILKRIDELKKKASEIGNQVYELIDELSSKKISMTDFIELVKEDQNETD